MSLRPDPREGAGTEPPRHDWAGWIVMGICVACVLLALRIAVA